MKRIILSSIAVLSWSLCHAQIQPPTQIDTLAIISMKYNYADIREENWPFSVIYKSTTDFCFGDHKYNIASAEKGTYENIVFTVKNANEGNTSYIGFYESEDNTVTILFSGYEFKCRYFKEYDRTTPIPFKEVDEKPLFMGGGADAFAKWVNERLEYPEAAKEYGIQGRVTLQFIVNEDGSLSDIKVLRGVDSSLDKEAVRVVSSSPKWTPGKQRGKEVKVTYTFPVIFQLR